VTGAGLLFVRVIVLASVRVIVSPAFAVKIDISSVVESDPVNLTFAPLATVSELIA